MTRILIFLAMASVCSAAPALAQAGTARPPSAAGSTAPAKPGEEDVLEGLVKGIVKAVVEEAQKPKETAPAAETGASPADPAPALEPIPAATPAPQPEPAASGAPTPPAPAEPAPPLATAAPKPEQPPETVLPPPEAAAAPEPAAPTAGSPVAVPAPPVRSPTPAIAEPPTDRPGLFWLPAILFLAATAVAAAGVHRARVIRTKRLLSLEARLEGGLGAGSASAFDFAAPPVSIRCRMEVEAAHG